jgi:hypothetical protein
MNLHRLATERSLLISFLLFGLLVAACSTETVPTDPLDSPSPPGRILGLVTGDDAPVSGVTVTLSRGGAELATVTTTGNGEFGFTGLDAGMYAVAIPEIAGMECSRVRAATVVPGEAAVVSFACVTPPPPAPRGSVGGRVTVNGVGARSVVVSLREGATTRTTSTDNAGLYRFGEVLVGVKIVEIRNGEDLCPTTSLEVSVTANGAATADFACTGEVLTGRVTVNGIPLPNVVVHVCQPVDWDFGLLCRTPSAATDSEGRYAYTSFPKPAFSNWYDPEGFGTGYYLVFVETAPAGVTCPEPESINVPSGATKTLDIACVEESVDSAAGAGYWDY